MNTTDKTGNEEEIIDSPTDTEPTENDLELEIDLDEEVDVEALRKENATLKAQKDHWRNKATSKVEAKPTPVDKTNSALSQNDLYSLLKADIAQEDIEDVTEYAKFKGISIQEALKSSAVKAILNEKAEARNVSTATHTGAAKRGTSKVSDEVLLAKASKGEMPDSDEDMDRLISLRYKSGK